MALSIWNDYYYFQDARGDRDRQRRCESDPVYAYHVRQGPHYPAKPPGDTPDKSYSALLCRSDGSLAPLVIITKRGLTGQNFFVAATQWERTNSVLCGPFKFYPVVNAMMEVTGHCANVWDSQLICPAGLSTPKGPISPEECIANEIPLYLWINEFSRQSSSKYGGEVSDNLNAPTGWESFRDRYHGGIDVLVLPNGKVVGAKGKPYQSNNGTTYAVMSPLDFWAPGSGLLAGGIRTLTSRIGAAALRGLDAIVAATAKDLTLLSARELALSSAVRFSRTLPGVAVSARGFTVEQAAGRTYILGEDMAAVRAQMDLIPTEAGFHDLVIHGESTGFKVLVRTEADGTQVLKDVSLREVADIIGPKLPPGVELRLLSCNAAKGPAKQLANDLNRSVWGANRKVWTKQMDVGGRKVLVPTNVAKGATPDGGKFFEFVPERGAAEWSGNAGKATGNEVHGEINRVHLPHPRPPR
jgi:hypothetical protein